MKGGKGLFAFSLLPAVFSAQPSERTPTPGDGRPGGVTGCCRPARPGLNRRWDGGTVPEERGRRGTREGLSSPALGINATGLRRCFWVQRGMFPPVPFTRAPHGEERAKPLQNLMGDGSKGTHVGKNSDLLRGEESQLLLSLPLG